MPIMRVAGQNPASNPPGIAFNLAALAAMILLAALGLSYLLDQSSRSAKNPLPQRDDQPTITQTIAGRELTIPATWFRYDEQVKDGFTQEVNLNFAIIFEPDTAPTIVDVSLVSAPRARASSVLLDTVYVHQFSTAMRTDIPGLVGKPLKSQGGFVGETVWYDALAPKPFVAKCADPVTPGGTAKCLRTVHLPSGLAAVTSFDAAALAHWRKFDSEMALWLSQIGAL